MIEAVVIDFDDTLCLTEAASFAMENETLRQMGRAAMPRDIHIKTWGKPLFEAISERSPGVDVQQFRELYNPVITAYTQQGKLDAIPDVNYHALDMLITAGKSIMILTSRTHDEVRHLITPDHLLASRVKTFYYRDVMEFHKPDPRAFDLLLRDSGLRPEQCVYVGDAISDAQAAKGAGMHFIASLESGLRTKADFDGLPVDAFVQRFPEIVDTVLALDTVPATQQRAN